MQRNRRVNVSTAIPANDQRVQLAPLISPTHSLYPWNNDPQPRGQKRQVNRSPPPHGWDPKLNQNAWDPNGSLTYEGNRFLNLQASVKFPNESKPG